MNTLLQEQNVTEVNEKKPELLSPIKVTLIEIYV